ncbi:MAG: isocitrate/isopropylmalate dehydrogenase family protein, partial [Burkholderiales bacterium]|nr:isocitrate/isopropylmalate dehydrogenase family protein [Burkholderiales bacterium]
IAGEGKANPTATVLSAAMMLDWLADRSGEEALAEAAVRIERAVDAVFASGRLAPYEFGGRDGTRAIAGAIASHL